MTRAGGVFEVVVLALCPRRDLDRFCQHYLNQGASRVRVFYDGDCHFEYADPRIEFAACDEAFWRSLGEPRPASVEARQRAVYHHAYADCRAEWLLVVDVDEFVFGPVDLTRLLACVGPEPDCVRFTSAEAVFTAGDDVHEEFGASAFRLPANKLISPLLSALVYGALATCFVRGLLGHSRGKQAIRAGLAGAYIGIHDASIPGRELHRLDATRRHGFMLAHFDAINFERWSNKCADRLRKGDALEMGRKRERQLALFGVCHSAAEQENLFRRLYALNRWQERLLRLAGLVHYAAPARSRAGAGSALFEHGIIAAAGDLSA